jgi:ankyrin repeat protein
MNNNSYLYGFIWLLIMSCLTVQVFGSMEPKYPIEQASQAGDTKLVKELLTKGQSQYLRDSALEYAIKVGNREIIDLLISYGARNALTKASETGDIKLVQYFLDRKPEKNECDSALHAAVCTGHKEIIELLLSSGADVNSLGNVDFTPLFSAVTIGGDLDFLYMVRNLPFFEYHDLSDDESRGTEYSPENRKLFLDIVELLIKNGANVNIKENESGFTPLHYAIYIGDKDIIETLIDHGAEVNPKLQSPDKYRQYISPLHIAAYFGDLEICKLLIKRGAEVDIKLPIDSGIGTSNALQTPLQYAVQSGNAGLVELFKNNGADINSPDSADQTPLHNAVISEDIPIVKLLISYGANVNAVDNQGWTPMHFAAEHKDKSIVEMLLSKGADPNPKSDDEQTPTTIAVHNGSGEIVKLLYAKHKEINIYNAASMSDIESLEKLVDKEDVINKINTQGRTALHSAVIAGQVQAVEWLLEHGADANCVDDANETAISISLGIAQNFCLSSEPNDVARFNTFRQILTLLIGHGATPDFSYGIPREIVLSHPQQVAELMVDAGPNLNEPYSDDKATTLLHRASWWGEKKVVEDLLDIGADINAVDSAGGTPLHAATQSCSTGFSDVFTGPHIEILEVLIQHGANVDAANNQNYTPLHGVAAYGDVNSVKLLLRNGANVNAVSKTNKTPLQYAASNGSTAIMDLLLAKGADPNVADNENNTPLLLLLSSIPFDNDEKRLEIIKYAIKLIRQGVKVDTQNNEGITLLQEAAALGYPELLEELLIRGAPVNLKSKTGWTALHSAVSSGDVRSVGMLLKYNAEINVLGTLPNMIRLPHFSHPAQTPLHIAISQGYNDIVRYNEIVRMLIASGADVNAFDGEKRTPLDVAVNVNNLEAETILSNSGVKK